MSKNITIIPPSEGRPDVLRVAAYCRVSTDLDEQASSYASQIRSYTELISQHEGWELVDIYADEAASGTKTDKREDFNRLLADCRKGKIDRVLVKSISRFSRNTKDCLAALRELMRLGVTVQFEKENIDTGTLTTELMVSVSGSLAQQESMSISQNIRMGYRRRMERGEFIASNKLRLHEGIILRPALDQMEALESAVQRENPAMLEINRAIAQATEQNYKISKLRASGLLDADACAAKLAALDAQLTQLRAKRRRLLRNDDISEMADALRQTVETLHQGPEQLDEFDEELFNEMVEKITVDTDHVLRFRLRGGFDVAEPLWRETR